MGFDPLATAETNVTHSSQTNAAIPATAAPSFDDHLARANALFKAGKLDEAQAVAQAAAQLDPKRFEAPAALALILHEANKPDDARAALDAAAKLTPLDKQEQLQRLAQLLGAKPAPTPANPAELTGAARRKYDTLLVIIEEAEKAGQDAERKKLLREFLDRSEPFLKEQPDQLRMWAFRASAALDLDLERETREADRELVRLKADELEDPGMRQLLIRLERRGWLGDGLAAMERRVEEERQERERIQQAEQARRAEEQRERERAQQAEQARRAEQQRRSLNLIEGNWVHIFHQNASKRPKAVRSEGVINFVLKSDGSMKGSGSLTYSVYHFGKKSWQLMESISIDGIIGITDMEEDNQPCYVVSGQFKGEECDRAYPAAIVSGSGSAIIIYPCEVTGTNSVREAPMRKVVCAQSPVGNGVALVRQ